MPKGFFVGAKKFTVDDFLLKHFVGYLSICFHFMRFYSFKLNFLRIIQFFKPKLAQVFE